MSGFFNPGGLFGGPGFMSLGKGLQFFQPARKRQTEYEVSLGDIRIATANGEAMFYHPTIDFSQFAGTGTGDATRLIQFEDSAGLKATAYCGARGGGETLGSELVVNGDMEIGNPPPNWVNNRGTMTAETAIVKSGLQSMKVTHTNIETTTYQRQVAGSVVSGGLYKGLISFYNQSEDNISATVYDGVVARYGVNSTNKNEWLNYINYRTFATSLDIRLFTTGAISGGGIGFFDSISFKKLTDVPTTGLHLLSSQNGTTRNMATQDVGFNPNAIVGVTVW